MSNIYKSKELDREATVANFATVQKEGKRDVEYYNLDAIISVGYRVNSKEGIKFRRWSSQVIKDHIVKGYSLNRQRVAEKGVQELQQAVEKKAAHLLYFIIKDHPFVDGNKRIGSFMFLLYLKTQGVEIKLNDNGLVALALLVADSSPKQKDVVIKLIANMIA